MPQLNNFSMSISIISTTFLTLISGYGAIKLYYNLRKQQKDSLSCQNLVQLKKISSKPSLKCNETGELVINYIKLQRDAIRTRNKYQKKLSNILEEIEELREEIYNFECQTTIKIHEILDEIEACQYLNFDSESLLEHIENLKLKLTEEEMIQIETIEMLQIELGHLIWRYRELEIREVHEWK
ncbi:471_t:CDS:1, partial [Diversispora eburnea]